MATTSHGDEEAAFDHENDLPEIVEQGLPAPAEAIPLAIFIEYRDAKGVSSARRITCRAIDLGAGTLLAFCHERAAMRAFRLDRILSAWSTDSGEAISLDTLPSRLMASGLLNSDERLKRVLTIMVYLMCCDGEVVRPELEVLEKVCTSYVLRFGGDESTVHHAIDMARVIAPTDRDFLLAINWIARHKERRALAAFVRQWGGEMIFADGILTPEEVAAGHVIDEALRAISTEKATIME